MKWFIILSSLLVSLTIGGYIKPTTNPVYLSSSNTGQTSSYSFSFTTETRILTRAQIKITFPVDFSESPFLQPCSAILYKLNSRVPLVCSSSGRTIELDVGNLDSGELMIFITDVTNPKSQGGTGYFKIETYEQATLKDSNGAFPGVAITQKSKTLTFSVTSPGHLVAGSISSYELNVSVDSVIPKGSWIRVYLPTYYTFDTSSGCIINNSSPISCSINSYDSTLLETSQLTTDLASSFKLTLRNISNPSISGTIGSFKLEILSSASTSVLYTSSYVSSLSISPGFIDNIQIQRGLPHLNTETYYYLRFRTTNSISSAGSVVVTFPSQYQGVSFCKVVSGLEPKDSVKCKFSHNVVTYSNFNAFKAGAIDLKMIAMNPNSPGTTEEFKISTYTPENILIDSTDQGGSFVFSDINHIQSLSSDVFKVKTDLSIGNFGSFEIVLDSKYTLPASTGIKTGLIELILPSSATLPTATDAVSNYTKLECLFGKSRITSKSCTYDSSTSTISILTPENEEFESSPLIITISTIGSPTTTKHGIMLAKPGTGHQMITIKTYIDQGAGSEQQEQANYFFISPARVISSTSDDTDITPGYIDFKLAHHSNILDNFLIVTYKNSLVIAADGKMRIELSTADNSFLRDLGQRLGSFKTVDFECVEIDMLDKVQKCTLTGGTETLPAVIDVTVKSAVDEGSVLKIIFPNMKSTKERDVYPSLTVKNIDSDGHTIEYETMTLDKLIQKNRNSCGDGGSITASNSNIVQENSDFVFTLPYTANLNTGDQILILFPPGFDWISPVTLATCAGSTGNLAISANYEIIGTSDFRFIRFTSSSTITPVSSELTICLTFPHKNTTTSSKFKTYILKLDDLNTLQVQSCLSSSLSAPAASSFTSTLAYKLPTTSLRIKGYTELISITFTLTKRVLSGSIWIRLPKTHYTLIDDECYLVKTSPLGTVCEVHTNGMYHSYVLTKFGTVNSGSEFSVIMNVNVLRPSSSSNIQITCVENDVEITDNTVETSSLSLNFSSYLSGLSVASVSVLTPYIDVIAGNYGPLVIKFTPNVNVLKRGASTVETFTINLPEGGLFGKPNDGYLECTIGGKPASYCNFSSDVISMKQPTEIELISGTEYEIVVTYRDSTSNVPGIKWPVNPGTYRIKIDFGATLNSISEPTVIVRPARITQATVESLTMSAGKPNILSFKFTITTALKNSNRSTETTPGSLYVWFPSSNWGDDLGLGFADMSQVDCLVDTSVTTATFLTGGLKCYLLKEYNGYTKILLSNIDDSSIGKIFAFSIPGIINPATTMTDMKLYISTEQEDVSDTRNPKTTWLNFIELDYIDTIYSTSVTPTVNTITANPFGLSVPAVPGESVSISLTFTPTAGLSSNDIILVKMPPDLDLSLLTCSIDSISITPVKYSLTNYLLLTLISGQSFTLGTSETILFGSIKLSPYVQSLSFITYHYKSHQLVEQISHTIDSSLFIPGDITVTTSIISNSPSYISSEIMFINIAFTLEFALSAGGYIHWEVFSGATTSATISASYCQLAIEGFSAGDFKCEVISDTYLKISGFNSDLPANREVIISLRINTPPAGTYDSIIKTHDGKGFVNAVTIASAITTIGFKDLKTFTIPDVVFYVKAYPVRPSSKIGDIEIPNMIFPIILKKAIGQVKIKFDRAISKVTDSVMKCIWTISSIEYLSSCSITSVNPSYFILVNTPNIIDVPASTAVKLFITSQIGGASSGVSFDGSSGLYNLKFYIDDDNTDITEDPIYWNTQLEILPDAWEVVVKYLHGIPNEFNMFKIQLTIPTGGIPGSSKRGRIVIEFSNVFEDDLGLGIDDGGIIHCSEEGVGPLICYLSQGNAANSIKPTVIVTGFLEYAEGSTKTIVLEKIKNPVTGGDNKILDMNVYAERDNIEPNTEKLFSISLSNVMTVRGTVTNQGSSTGITISSGGNACGATGVKYRIILKIPTGGFLVGDEYMIYLDPIATINSSPTHDDITYIDKFQYFSSSNMLYISFKAARTTSLTIEITDFTNPSYDQQLVYNYYTARSGMLVSKGSITSVATGFVTKKITTSNLQIRREDLGTVFYKNDITSYILSFSPTVLIPKAGSIRIFFRDIFTVHDSTCINYYPPNLSNLLTPYICEYTANKMLISANRFDMYEMSGFDADIPANTQIMIKVTVKNPSVAGTYKVIVRTNYKVGQDNEFEVMEDVSITINALEVPSYYDIPGQYLAETDMRVNEIGPVKLVITIPEDMTNGTNDDTEDYVSIKLPGFQDSGLSDTLMCMWDGKEADSCTGNTEDYKVFLVAGTLKQGKNTLVISSKNYKDVNQFGLRYPSTAGPILVVITINIGTKQYIMNREIMILPAVKFQSLTITSYNPIHASESFLRIDFKHPNAMTSANSPYLKICFPTKDQHGSTIFPDDMGFGKSDGATIPCGMTSAISVECILNKGYSATFLPVCLTVNIKTNTVASTAYTLFIYGFTNPTLTSSTYDILHVSAKIVSYSGSVYDVGQTYPYIYTIENDSIIESANGSYTLAKSGTNLAVTLPLTGCQTDNVYLIKGQNDFKYGEVTCAPALCKILNSEAKFIVMYGFSTANCNTIDASGVTFTIPLKEISTLPGDLTVYLADTDGTTTLPNKMTKQKFTTTSTLSDATASNVIIAVDSTTGGVRSWYTFSITPDVSIAAGSYIEIDFSSSQVKPISTTCYNDSPTVYASLANYSCTIADDKLLIQSKYTTGLDYDNTAVTAAIKLRTYFLNPIADNSISLTVNIYFSNSLSDTNLLRSYTYSQLYTYSTKVSKDLVYIPVQESLYTAAKRTEAIDIRFKLNPPENMTANTDKIKIDISSITVATTYIPSCEIISQHFLRQAAFCYTKDSSIEIIPTVDLIAGSEYEVVVYAKEGSIKLKTTTEANLDMELFIDTQKYKYIDDLTVVSTYFGDLDISYLHTTPSEENIFCIKFKPAAALTAANDVIFVEFPTVNEYGQNLFENDLGSGLMNGGTIPCETIVSTGTLNASCQISLGDSASKKPARVIVKFSAGIAITKEVELYISKVENPAASAVGTPKIVSITVGQMLQPNHYVGIRTISNLFQVPTDTTSTTTDYPQQISGDGSALLSLNLDLSDLPASENFSTVVIEFSSYNPYIITGATGNTDWSVVVLDALNILICTYTGATFTNPAVPINLASLTNGLIPDYTFSSIWSISDNLKLYNKATYKYAMLTGWTAATTLGNNNCEDQIEVTVKTAYLNIHSDIRVLLYPIVTGFRYLDEPSLYFTGLKVGDSYPVWYYDRTNSRYVIDISNMPLDMKFIYWAKNGDTTTAHKVKVEIVPSSDLKTVYESSEITVTSFGTTDCSPASNYFTYTDFYLSKIISTTNPVITFVFSLSSPLNTAGRFTIDITNLYLTKPSGTSAITLCKAQDTTPDTTAVAVTCTSTAISGANSQNLVVVLPFAVTTSQVITLSFTTNGQLVSNISSISVPVKVENYVSSAYSSFIITHLRHMIRKANCSTTITTMSTMYDSLHGPGLAVTFKKSGGTGTKENLRIELDILNFEHDLGTGLLDGQQLHAAYDGKSTGCLLRKSSSTNLIYSAFIECNEITGTTTFYFPTIKIRNGKTKFSPKIYQYLNTGVQTCQKYNGVITVSSLACTTETITPTIPTTCATVATSSTASITFSNSSLLTYIYVTGFINNPNAGTVVDTISLIDKYTGHFLIRDSAADGIAAATVLTGIRSTNSNQSSITINAVGYGGTACSSYTDFTVPTCTSSNFGTVTLNKYDKSVEGTYYARGSNILKLTFSFSNFEISSGNVLVINFPKEIAVEVECEFCFSRNLNIDTGKTLEIEVIDNTNHFSLVVRNISSLSTTSATIYGIYAKWVSSAVSSPPATIKVYTDSTLTTSIISTDISISVIQYPTDYLMLTSSELNTGYFFTKAQSTIDVTKTNQVGNFKMFVDLPNDLTPLVSKVSIVAVAGLGFAGSLDSTYWAVFTSVQNPDISLLASNIEIISNSGVDSIVISASSLGIESGLYQLTIGANHISTPGLTYVNSKAIDYIEVEDSVGTYKDYSYSPIYSRTYNYPLFADQTVSTNKTKFYSGFNEGGIDNFVHLTMIRAVSTVNALPAYVIEFPTVDVLDNSLFDYDLGTPFCSVFERKTTTNSVRCAIEYYDSGSLIQNLKYPAKLYIIDNVPNTGTTLNIMLYELLNPSEGSVIDILTYTQLTNTVSTNDRLERSFIKAALCIQAAASISVVSNAYPTGTDIAKIGVAFTSSNSITLDLDGSLDLNSSQNEFIILKFPLGFYELTNTWNDGTDIMIMNLDSGYLAILNTAFSASTITLYNFSNINRVPIASDDYFITALISTKGVTTYKYIYDDTPPVSWTKGLLTLTTNGNFGLKPEVAAADMETYHKFNLVNTESFYKFDFEANISVPSGGKIVVTFDSSFTLGICNASSDGFSSDLVACVIDTTEVSLKRWAISNFGSLKAGEKVSVYGYATTGSSLGSTVTDFKISTYYTSDTIIATGRLLEEVSDGEFDLDSTLYGSGTHANFVMDWQYNIGKRMYSHLITAINVPLVVTINPKYILNSSSHTVVITLPSTSTYYKLPATTCKVYCMFKDQSTSVSYKSSSCTFTGTATGVWTVSAPANSVISTSKTYDIVITTHGCENSTPSYNGLKPYDADKPYNLVKIRVNAATSTQCDMILPYVKPIDSFKALPLVLDVEEINFFKISFKDVSAVPASGTAAIVVEFEVKNEEGESVFEEDLGLGISNYASLDCDNDLSSDIMCYLVKSSSHNQKGVETAAIVIDDFASFTDVEKVIWLPLIKNPTSTDIWVNLKLIVYKLDTTTNKQVAQPFLQASLTHLYKPKTLLTKTEIDDLPSIATALGADSVMGGIDKSFTLSVATAVTASSNDFTIWKFPHKIIGTSFTIDTLAPLALFPNIGYAISPPQGPTSHDFDFDLWDIPAYAASTIDMTSYHTLNQQISTVVKYNNSAKDTYDVGSFEEILGSTIRVTTLSGGIYANYYDRFTIKVMKDTELLGGSFTLTMPNSFTELSNLCYVLNRRSDVLSIDSTKPTCVKSGQVYKISNLLKVRAFVELTIRFWGKINAAGAHSMTLAYYSDALTTYKVLESTESITATTIQYATGSITTPAKRTSFTPLRVSAIGQLYFTIVFTTAMTMKTGYITIEFDSPIVTVPISTYSELRCTWTDTSTSIIYSSHSCEYASNLIKVYSPTSTSLSNTKTWTLTITSVNNEDDNEGVEISSTASTGYHNLIISTYPAGILKEKSTGSYFLPPATAFNSMSVTSKSGTESSVTTLDFVCKLGASLDIGIEKTNGNSEIVIEVFSNWASMMHSFVVSTNSLSEIHGSSTLVGAKYYLQKSGVTPNQILIRNFDAVANGGEVKVTLYGLRNPSGTPKMISFRMYVRKWDNGNYVVMQYGEIIKGYQILVNDKTNRVNQGITYASKTYDTTTNVTFKVISVNDLEIGDHLYFRLYPSAVILTNAVASSTHTLTFLPKYNMILIELTAAISSKASAQDLVLSNLPNPSYPITQIWKLYILNKEILTDEITYASITYPVGLTTASISYSKYSLIAHNNPTVGYEYQIVMKFTTAHNIPKGGSIVIGLDSGLIGMPSKCKVEHGLWPYQCSVIGSEIIITGFEKYDKTQINLPSIVVSFVYSVTQTDSALLFSVNIYGVDGTSTTKLETNASFSAGFNLVSPSKAILPATIVPPIEERTQSGLNTPSELIVTLKPSVTSASSGYLVKLTLPSGYSLSSGVLECFLMNSSNSVPALCSNDGTSILLTIPVQMSLDTTSQKQIKLRVRDSGLMSTNGILIPSATTVLSYSTPFPNLPVTIELLNSSSTTLEAAKTYIQSLGQALNTFTVSPGHYNLNKPNIFDITFKPNSNFLSSSYIQIEFPTHDGTNNIWDISMGLAKTEEFEIDCSLSISSVYDLTVKCVLIPAESVGMNKYVKVKVMDYAQIDSGNECVLRIVKLYNPVNSKFKYENTVNLKVSVRMSVYSSDGPDGIKIGEGVDYDVFSAGLSSSSATALSIGSVSSNTSTTYTEYTTGNGLIVNLQNGSAVISDSKDFLIIEVDSTLTLPAKHTVSTITCTSSASCTALPYKLTNWIIITSTGFTTSGSITLESAGISNKLFKSPHYTKSSYSMTVYSISDHIITEIFTGSFGSISASSANFSISNMFNIESLNSYTLFLLSVTPLRASNMLKKVEIQFPSEYLWIDKYCRSYSGVKNAVSCESDCDSDVCDKKIIISGFEDTDPSDSITVKIGGKTPSSTTVSDSFKVKLYASDSDDSMIIESSNVSEPTSYTSLPYPTKVWFDWVTQDIYQRTAQAGQTGEIYLKFKPRSDIYPNYIVRFTLPQGFDIAAGGSVYCYIATGDQPFYNDSLSRHISPKICTYSNRVITIVLPNSSSNFSGLLADKSSILILGSTGGTDYGFKVPYNPGYYTVELEFLSNSSNIIEQSTSSLYIPGVYPPSLDIFHNHRLIGTYDTDAIFGFRFITDRTIPRGYEYSYMNTLQPISHIEIQFEVFESFEVNLGKDYKAEQNLNCYGIQGIEPKSGESLICKVSLGETDSFRTTPTKITITNFQNISAGTKVEIHIPALRNPNTVDFKPTVGLGVYQIESNSRVTWLYSMKHITLSAVTDPGSASVTADSISPSLSTSIVGKSATLTLPFSTDSEALLAADTIIISFPTEWGRIESGYSLTIKDVSGFLIDSPSTITYFNDRMISLTLTTALSSSTEYSIVISNFMNPTYTTDCTSCGIVYYSISSYQFKHYYTTIDISDSPIAITAAGLQNHSINFSSFYAEDVNVSLLITMETEIVIEKDSEMVVYLADSFSSLLERKNASCSVVPVDLKCSIVERGAQITGFNRKKNDTVIVTILGIKNPAKTKLAIGTSGMRVEVKNSLLKRILYYEFTEDISFLNPKTPETLNASITSEFKTAGVRSTYKVKFYTTISIHSGASILVSFPSQFSLPSTLECNIEGVLTSFSSCLSSQNTISLLISQSIPTKSSLTLSFRSIISPTISSSYMDFSPFTVSIEYDKSTLASSDESAGIIRLYSSPSELSVVSSKHYPKNMGEYATYEFDLKSSISLPQLNTVILLEFPKQFANHLLPNGVSLVCEMENKFDNCEVSEYRRVKIYGNEWEISPDNIIRFKIFGIANPSIINTEALVVYAYDKNTLQVLAYKSDGGTFTNTAAAQAISLTSIDFTNKNVNTITDAIFTFSIGDYDITNSKGSIWIDWPLSYSSVFTRDTYGCELSISGQTSSVTCEWLSITNRQRVEVSNISYLPSNSSDISLKFSDIPTPRSSTKLTNFNLQTYDTSKSIVLEKTFYNLASSLSVEFKANGSTVSTPKYLEVYRGILSDSFNISLSKPSSDGITITPNLSGVEFTPSKVSLQYSWKDAASMRVGIPLTMNTGVYSVYWTISNKAYNTPQNTLIKVKDSSSKFKISIDSLPDTPRGTTTTQIAVHAEAAPVDQLILSLQVDQDLQDYFIFNPTSVVFSTGETLKYFNITTTTSASSTSIKFRLSGEASSIFTLSSDVLPINILAPDTQSAIINSIQLQNISKTTARIKIHTSNNAVVYYLYSYKGTVQPVIQSLINGYELINDVPNIYGVTYTISNLKYAEIYLENLDSNTEYVIHAASVSLSGIAADTVKSLEFKTKTIQSPASFKLYTTALSTPSKVIEAVALTLAIPQSYLSFTGIDPADYKRRRLVEKSITAEISYELTLTIPSNEDLDSPIKMIRTLDFKKELIKEYLPEINEDVSIAQTATELKVTTLEFKMQPNVVKCEKNAVSVKASLGLDGIVSAVALKSEFDQPNARQIVEGLNSRNIKVKEGHSIQGESIKMASVILELSNLEENEEYNIWFAGKNNNQLSTDYMTDDQVFKLTIVPEASEVETEEKLKLILVSESFRVSISVLCFILLMSI